MTSSGRVRVSEDGYEVQGMRVQIGDAVVRLDGVVGLGPDLSGTDLKFDADAPDLSLFASYVEDLNLPRQAFSTSGKVRVNESGYEFTDTTASLGEAILSIDGMIGRRSKLTDTNISLVAEGPDFAEIAAIANVTVPAAPFRIAARTERLKRGLRLREASAKIGENELEFTGTLGDPPAFIGTDLDLIARGPNLDLISEIADLDRSLSAYPYEISGHLDGTPEAFRLQSFTARLGESDLSGSFDLELADKPDLKGEFSSQYLDLKALLAEEQGESLAEKDSTEKKDEPAAQEPEPDPKRQPQYLIADTPLDLSGLNTVNANIRFSAEKVRTVAGLVSDVDFRLRLRDGSLKLEPISARDQVGGSVSATATLSRGDGGYIVAIEGKGEKLHLGILSAKGEDPANQPPLDFYVVFKGRGNSLHEFAAGGNGRIELVQGGGRISNSALNLLAADLSLELLNALNPFRKDEPYTKVECGVYGVKIVDGVATLNPFAARTDKMTVVGSGRIDLKTERIDLTWNTRPRKGLGISASAITNPYVRLGGTLSSPAIGLKPTEAALSTGAAVATGGLSILAKGLFDRLRAEADVCKSAREQLGGAPDG